VIVLNLLKRVSRFGGRTQKFMMKCPAVLEPPNREYIQCDSDFIQVRICDFLSFSFSFQVLKALFFVCSRLPERSLWITGLMR